MSALLDPPESQRPEAAQYQSASSGIWQLAWQRLKRDRVAMASLVIVALFMFVILLSALGLIASNWDDQVGVSYASPTFIGKVDNSEALSAEAALPELAVNLLSRVHDQRVHQYQYAATIASFSILAMIRTSARSAALVAESRR